jgi:hypothetical protein
MNVRTMPPWLTYPNELIQEMGDDELPANRQKKPMAGLVDNPVRGWRLAIALFEERHACGHRLAS